MQLQDIELSQITPSTKNTRVEYNGTDMAELVKSIDQVGVLNPIIIRQTNVSMGAELAYEIIAGHRRFHAVKQLGRETIPARIMNVTDEDADQMRLIENLHRKDLNPIEEAEAFKKLRDDYALHPEEIGGRADKSKAYVVRALALLMLPEIAVAAIRSGRMQAEYGHQIARASEDKQERLAKFASTPNEWSQEIPTLFELKQEIQKSVEKDLKKAPFPLDVDFYGGDSMPACNSCVYNTGNQNMLFDGATEGKCTNPVCYNDRSKFTFEQMRQKIQEKSPKLKFIGFGTMPGYMDFKEIKGYPIVDQAKRKKEIRDNPEKFGFAIMKPSSWDKKKGATVFIVNLNKKAKPEVAESKDYDRERYINERIEICLVEWANKQVPEIGKKHVIQMLEVEGKEEQALFKKSLPELMKTLWLQYISGWNIKTKLKDAGIETSAIEKTAAKEAAKMYDTEKASKKEIKK